MFQNFGPDVSEKGGPGNTATQPQLPMKTKQNASLRASALQITLRVTLISLSAVLLTLAAARVGPEATNKASQRTVTLADRVAYGHAVEEVYCLHRIWPKENLRP